MQSFVIHHRPIIGETHNALEADHGVFSVRSPRAAASPSAGATLAFGTGFWRSVLADTTVAGPGPYGPPAGVDANGIRVPDAFRSRVAATSGAPVENSRYVWRIAPDGAATFPAADGGWHYVCNSETVGNGGVGAIHFAADGSVTDAYRILSGTNGNCAGGPTPWGTWLSCEEFDFAGDLPLPPPLDLGAAVAGMVWECDPTGPGQGIARPAMGRFSHEAAAVDEHSGRVFLTEDQGDSKLYAFHPRTPGDLSAGSLHALVVDPADDSAHERASGPMAVSWVPVPDPFALGRSVRSQAPEAATFRRGEGMWIDSGVVYFATTSDERIWSLTLGRDDAPDVLEMIYDGRDSTKWTQTAAGAPLWDPDNVTVSPAGELFVSEDSGDLRISVTTNPDDAGQRTITPFLQLDRGSHDGSELTGPCFDPSGTRLYFSSQRGGPTGQGITYEITGPFTSARSDGPEGPPTGPGKDEDKGRPGNPPGQSRRPRS